MNNQRRRSILTKLAQSPFEAAKGLANRLTAKPPLSPRARMKRMDRFAIKNIAGVVGGEGGRVARNDLSTLRTAAGQQRKAVNVAKKRIGTFKSIASSPLFKKLTSSNTQVAAKKPAGSGMSPVVRGVKPPSTSGESFKVSPGASDLSGARRAKTSPAQLSERKGFTPGGTNFQRDKLNAFRSGLRSAGNTMGVRMGSRGKL